MANHFNRALLSLLLLGVFSRFSLEQSVDKAASFLIEPNRPIVYLHAVRFGLGSPEEDSKRHKRIWLELHNNCSLPIALTVNGAPAGDTPDSVSVMDQLVMDPVYRVLTPEEDSALGPKKIPRDTSFDVGSRLTIPPRKFLLFSLPATHFSKRWSIHIPFRFDLPAGKGMRDDNAWGGETLMFLSYSFYDLPEPAKKALAAGKESWTGVDK